MINRFELLRGCGLLNVPAYAQKLESYFEFSHLETNWRTEILAGITTFLTMAYIVLVNPAILADAGVPLPAVTAATCLSAAFGSILMGVVARYPIALAPGMGLNAYFTYTVCIKMHIPWQTALGAVFLSGIIFLALTGAGIRQMILRAIPHELYAAVASGIGLFIAFIGFQHAGLVVRDPNTLVGLGNIKQSHRRAGPLGLILMVALEVKKVRGSILIGVLSRHRAASALSMLPPFAGLVHLDARGRRLPVARRDRFSAQHSRRTLQGTAGDHLRLLLRRSLRQPRHPGRRHQARGPHLRRSLHSPSQSHPVCRRHGHRLRLAHRHLHRHQLRGIHRRRGRRRPQRRHRHRHRHCSSWPPLWRRPFVGIVPTAATAPALILVGSLMLATITEIRWHEPLVAVPAFLTLVLIPLTYSIANGLGFGIIAWAVLHLVTGKFRKQDWLLYTLAALFLVRFVYLGAS